MIDAILPDKVIAVETRKDSANGVLFPAEVAALGRAVEERRREFTTARSCAQMAFAELGFPPLPVTTGEGGEPQWPLGLVGSITHCEGYRACAVARSTDMVTLGIDAEPNAALPAGVLSEIVHSQELAWLGELMHDLPEVRWDRLLFSAKESVYKACYPVSKRRLGFEDTVLTVEPCTNSFRARLICSPTLEGRLANLSGRWLVQDGLLLTSVVLAAPGTGEHESQVSQTRP